LEVRYVGDKFNNAEQEFTSNRTDPDFTQFQSLWHFSHTWVEKPYVQFTQKLE
jgi:hypothetical protein